MGACAVEFFFWEAVALKGHMTCANFVMNPESFRIGLKLKALSFWSLPDMQ